MQNFPRMRNGHQDDGSQLSCTVGQKCPNCGSGKYKQTLSTESCSDCGLEYNYWGSGGNEVYKGMQRRDERAAIFARMEEEQREEEEHKREMRAQGYDV